MVKVSLVNVVFGHSVNFKKLYKKATVRVCSVVVVDGALEVSKLPINPSSNERRTPHRLEKRCILKTHIPGENARYVRPLLGYLEYARFHPALYNVDQARYRSLVKPENHNIV